MRRLRVAVLSQGDGSSAGGAGRIAEMLVHGLRCRNVDVTHVVRHAGRWSDPAIRRTAHFRGEALFRNAIHADLAGGIGMAMPAVRRADVVHFHDVGLAFGARVAMAVAARKPTVVTLHDFSSAAGGCIHPGACERWSVGCGECPQVGSWPLALPVDRTRQAYRLLSALAAQPGVRAVAPSSFMRERAAGAAWRGRDVRLILNAVDGDAFRPGDRERARARLGIERDELTLLFTSFRAGTPTKGFAELADAFSELAPAANRIRMLLLGDGERQGTRLAPWSRYITSVGHLDRPDSLSEVYSAADVTVAPTRADNAPCSLLESLACGTPVIAYDTGGIAELLDGCEAARVLREKSAPAIRAAVMEWRDALLSGALRTTARRFAVERRGPGAFLDAHLELYRQMVEP